MNWLQLATLGLASYAVTTVITIGHIALPFRQIFRAVTFKLRLPGFNRWYESDKGIVPITDDDVPSEIENPHGFDFITCPLCTGFWVSVTLALTAGIHSPMDILAIYGLSYLLNRIEKF